MPPSPRFTICLCFFVFSFLVACGSKPEQKAAPESGEKSKPSEPKPEKSAQGVDSEPVDSKPVKLVPHEIKLADGRSHTLNIPEGFEISVAAEGLKRVRFLAKSPDDRFFVTDMYNLADNTRGTVYILDGFDAGTGKFNSVTVWAANLRNPNNLAFYRDKNGVDWMYLALTDKLVRRRYIRGETAPTGEPETLATYPDYGLDYKYGGWHLTRTVAVSDTGKIYVTVGSSCNACEEKEEIRATVSEMDPDGTNQRIFASGLRNAVGMRILRGQIFVTNMGADHLGDDAPEETMHLVREGKNYGWPACYEFEGKIRADEKFAEADKKVQCGDVPLAYATFPAHASPLGFDYFDSKNEDKRLRRYFLVALHGSTKKSLDRGYRVVRVKKGAPVEDFITGFKEGETVRGRPCDILNIGPDAFLLTDDFAGVIYFVRPKKPV